MYLTSMRCLRSLRENGWWLGHHFNYRKAKKIVQSIGKTVMVTNVSIKHSGGGPLVTSHEALDLHTDHHKVKYISWYCFSNSDEGGETLLSDFYSFYNVFQQEELLELEKIFIKEKIFLDEYDVFHDRTTETPLLRKNNDGKYSLCFAFWLTNNKDKEKPVLKKFRKHAGIKASQIKLAKCDILIINNRRILHGRTEIKGNQNRKLERRWIK